MYHQQLGNTVPLLPVSIPGNQQPPPTQDTLPPLEPATRVSYDNIFFQLVGRDSAILNGVTAKPFFLKSNLPNKVLAQIWFLADIDADGALDREEFAIAYHLCQAGIKGIPIPATLPRYLVPQSKAIYHVSSAATQEDWVNMQNTVNVSTSVGQQQYSMPMAPLQPQLSQRPYYPQQQGPPLAPQIQAPTQPLSSLPQPQNYLYHQQHMPVHHQYSQMTVPNASISSVQQFQTMSQPQAQELFGTTSSDTNNLFYDGSSTDSTGQLVFVPAPVEVRGRDLDAANTYALGAGASFEQRIALTTELGDAMKRIQQKNPHK